MLRLFGTTCRCLSIQPFQLLPSRNIWRHMSLTWPFPHRHLHARWPVDVTELFLRFCCWTLIRLSLHWAWLCREYWHYRNVFDWLKKTLLSLSLSHVWYFWLKISRTLKAFGLALWFGYSPAPCRKIEQSSSWFPTFTKQSSMLS